MIVVVSTRPVRLGGRASFRLVVASSRRSSFRNRNCRSSLPPPQKTQTGLGNEAITILDALVSTKLLREEDM